MTQKQIEDLFIKQWGKTQIFLRGRFSRLNKEQCDDVFCDSMEFLQLIAKERDLNFDGEKGDLRLSVYFKNICIHKAQELITTIKKIDIDDYASGKLSTGQFREENIDYLLSLDDPMSEDLKTRLRDFVRNLPKACDEILWGYYVYEETLKELAKEIHTSHDYAKKKKINCFNKFVKNCPREIKESRR